MAIIGVFVPGLPTTVFVIAASYLFARSSPRLERWLERNRWLGPPLQRFRQTRGMPRKSKVLALASMWTGAWPEHLRARQRRRRSPDRSRRCLELSAARRFSSPFARRRYDSGSSCRSRSRAASAVTCGVSGGVGGNGSTRRNGATENGFQKRSSVTPFLRVSPLPPVRPVTSHATGSPTRITPAVSTGPTSPRSTSSAASIAGSIGPRWARLIQIASSRPSSTSIHE